KKEQLIEILQLQLTKLKERFKNLGKELMIEDSVLPYLAELGYDPRFGARPLKRVIQRELMDELAMQMLAVPEAQTWRVNYQKSKIEISYER
ncbi:MAG TPA: hypothetical protein PLQ36_01265, partial [Candidatus Gracilibacteria bacterium]|nr:hypothetical protein [Candidatus Gracilibacteria bacterium]